MVKTPEHHIEVVAPHLKKPEARIVLPEGPSSVQELSQRRIITRELLTEKGFIVVENYQPATHQEANEVSLTANKTQGFHQDPRVTVLSLRFPPQKYLREADTGVCDLNDLLCVQKEFTRKYCPSSSTFSKADYFEKENRFLEEKGFLARIHWKPDQLLLIDNETMAHARLPHPGSPEKSRSRILRRYLRWLGEVLE